MPAPHIEADETWMARYKEACRQFKADEISKDVFGAKLFGLSFRGQALQSEINLNWPKVKT